MKMPSLWMTTEAKSTLAGSNMILGIFKMRQGPLPRRADQLAIAMRALSTNARYPG
jgi:hypothetical protein